MDLVPGRLRTRAWWTVAGLGALVVAGGLVVRGDSSPLGIELRIVHSVDSHAGGTARWNPVFDSVIPWAIIATLTALIGWALTRHWWRALVACAAVPLAIELTELVLKPLVGRGPARGLLYPSGHVTGVAATVTLVVVLVGFRIQRRLAIGLLVGVALAGCAGAALAAVATHAHGPLDTVAGLPTGAAVALAWMLAVDSVAEIVPPSRPPAPESWLGAARGTGRIVGDIIEPVAGGEEWEALEP